MGMSSRIVLRIAAAAGIIVAGIVGEYLIARKVEKGIRAEFRPDPAVERAARLTPVVDPAPVPAPTALPLTGGDGALPDGYPIAHIDGAAFRSLLVHGKYEDLDRYFEELQNDFEADNKREAWIDGAADAFGSAEPSLEPLLDAWVAATPNSFAPYLARADHWNAVGWARRGTKWAQQTPGEDTDAMKEAMAHATADLNKALAIKPRLVTAMLLRVRVLTTNSKTKEMRAQVDRATAVCPGCFSIREAYLLGTRPRWNGTYEAMHAFAATCDPAKNARCRVLDGFEDYDLADLAFADKRIEDAQQAIDRAVVLGDCSVFLTLRAHIRLARKDVEGSLADAQKAVALRYGVEPLAVEAEALYTLQRWEPAGQALLEAVRLDPTDARIKEIAGYTVKGLALDGWKDAQAGRRDDALRKLDLAAEMAPSTRELIAMRAQVLAGDLYAK
jgi:tetratricopeptide (TPR) repeat protein